MTDNQEEVPPGVYFDADGYPDIDIDTLLPIDGASEFERRVYQRAVAELDTTLTQVLDPTAPPEEVWDFRNHLFTKTLLMVGITTAMQHHAEITIAVIMNVMGDDASTLRTLSEKVMAHAHTNLASVDPENKIIKDDASPQVQEMAQFVLTTAINGASKVLLEDATGMEWT